MATLTHAIEVEDTLAASVRFTNGALGSVVATTAAAPGYPHRIEVYGDRGGMQIEGEQIVRWESEALPQLPGVTLASPGMAAAGAGSSPRGISQRGHQRLIADMVAAIQGKRQPIVSGEQGRRSLALALAIYEAARSGRRVQVDTPYDAAEQER
jgi:predicted dehydrogenase